VISPRLPRVPAPRRRGAALIVVIAVLSTAGCGGDGPPEDTAAGRPTAASTAVPTAGASPTDIDPALLEPLTMLGPCTVDPNTIDEQPAPGALFPDDTVLTSQTQDGPLTQIKGYIPMTPVQIRVFYQRQDVMEVLQIEDEIRESEILLGDGDNRLFVKAQAICELGSVFLAVLAPQSAGGQVPEPALGGN
jgi:hypothetical protein